ncbi:MAG: chloride channel protein [Reinekea sp.]|nr:chloride channel protein [Reinekea sp.]
MRFKKHWQMVFFQGNSLALLSLLGILIGIATSMVIAWFMVAIDAVLAILHGNPEAGFSGFSFWMRLILPIAGAIVLILLARLTKKSIQEVGIAHVIDRLQRGRAKLPVINSVYQFFAALIALASGFSMGKEGPAVHIGSTIASKMGYELNRTPSQLRLLTGCGTAAAISAAFGTPLAGVMFAMEVVLMEYSLNGFIPIVAASVTAAAMAQLFLGDHPAFFQIDVKAIEYADGPWLLLTGIATGVVAAVMHKLIKQFLSLNLVRVEYRFLLAGLITGLLGVMLPQVMGLGYDTMNAILTGQFAWWLLLAILVGKLVATSAAVGLGIPAGIVAPSLVIGMATGAVIGYLAPGDGNDSFYALIGMAGLMSALLHAPLAALTAVLELSLSAQMMFPAMIVVVLSNLTCQVLFLQPSIFQTMLANKGLHITTHPMRNALASRFLTEIATEQFCVMSSNMDTHAIEELLATHRRLVVFRFGTSSYLLPMTTLQKQFEHWTLLENRDSVDLLDYLAKVIPDRSRIAIINNDVSLLEGIKILQSDDVVGIQVPLDEFRIGLVTRSKLSAVLTTEGELH